ncbi:MAG: beta-N-acetylhexosaminidase [Faecalimonas sp.]|nr:beta-N-acetylhexosaminidase [Faecalimonas sp.]
MLGVMIDCSRNAVMSLQAVKEYVDLLAKMGYDTVMLYTEDTYEVKDEPYFGYMRGRYTKQEFQELDAYCKAKGIELVPCIQTLAHCNAIFQVTNVYDNVRDCDDILLIDGARTYELLERMFASLAESFSSRKIHIGMDEAEKVGLGKYLKEHGYTERFDLINKHLHKVCEIAKKYGFEPMIWSDMFCRLAAGTADYYAGGDVSVIREKANLPDNVTLVYWDYYSNDYDHYVKMFRTNKAFGRPVAFAGGAWTWKGFAPDNVMSIDNTAAAVKACNAEGVEDVLFTMWGDDGAEGSRFAVLPSLLYAAELKRGNADMEDIKAKFLELTGIAWDSFLLLDKLDTPGGKHTYNPSKYLLYNDPFTGLNDYRVTVEDGAYYADLAEKLSGVVKDLRACTGRGFAGAHFLRLFETAEALCRLLAEKAPLGVKTRAAYAAGDKAALKELAEGAYCKAIQELGCFYDTFWIQWQAENKPFGFDIQDFRIGGVQRRLESCRQRLLAYAAGNEENIPELETELLEGTGKMQWTNIATPNVVSHITFP